MDEEPKKEPVKHVIKSVFGTPEEKERWGMTVQLHEHETIGSLDVSMPVNLNAHDWRLGDTVTLTVVGIKAKIIN